MKIDLRIKNGKSYVSQSKMQHKKTQRSYSVDSGQKQVRFLLESHPDRFPTAGHLPKPPPRPSSAISPWARAFKAYMGFSNEDKTHPAVKIRNRRLGVSFSEFSFSRGSGPSEQYNGHDKGMAPKGDCLVNGENTDNHWGVDKVTLPELVTHCNNPSSLEQHDMGGRDTTSFVSSQLDDGVRPNPTCNTPDDRDGYSTAHNDNDNLASCSPPVRLQQLRTLYYHAVCLRWGIYMTVPPISVCGYLAPKLATYLFSTIVYNKEFEFEL